MMCVNYIHRPHFHTYIERISRVNVSVDISFLIPTKYDKLLLAIPPRHLPRCWSREYVLIPYLSITDTSKEQLMGEDTPEVFSSTIMFPRSTFGCWPGFKPACEYGSTPSEEMMNWGEAESSSITVLQSSPASLAANKWKITQDKKKLDICVLITSSFQPFSPPFFAVTPNPKVLYFGVGLSLSSAPNDQIWVKTIIHISVALSLPFSILFKDPWEKQPYSNFSALIM